MSQLIERIILRLTSADYSELLKRAKEEGTDISKYVRGIINEHLHK